MTTEKSWRGWRYCVFACTVEDSANVMLALSRISFVTHVSYKPADGFVRYEIDLASPTLGSKADGQCAEETVKRELHKVVALHTVPEPPPEAA